MRAVVEYVDDVIALLTSLAALTTSLVILRKTTRNGNDIRELSRNGDEIKQLVTNGNATTSQNDQRGSEERSGA